MRTHTELITPVTTGPQAVPGTATDPWGAVDPSRATDGWGATGTLAAGDLLGGWQSLGTLLLQLAPLALGALLLWTGMQKLLGPGVQRQAVATALERVLGGVEPAARALRVVGAVEVLVALGLLAAPTAPGAGGAAVLLGAGFAGYLGYARVKAPGASCGCSARDTAPIGPRAFLRAAGVLVAGVASTTSSVPWWEATAQRPGAALALLAGYALVGVALFADLDRWWLLPLRRLRLRLLGHPLLGPADPGPAAPVAASVELLERSLAWEAAAPLIRSGLLDHWDADDWRFLLYSGAQVPPAADDRGGEAADREPAAPRAVSVLFAMDPGATLDNAGRPLIRVTVIDERTQRPVDGLLADVSARTVLPLAP